MEHVRVSTAVRAIEGRFVFDKRSFRGVVCATLIERAFGARACPDGWLDAYRANAGAIDAALAAKAKIALGVQVAVLTESDLGLFSLRNPRGADMHRLRVHEVDERGVRHVGDRQGGRAGRRPTGKTAGCTSR